MDHCLEYWTEALSQALEECGATLTDEQLASVAASLQISHENYGMAFYTPPLDAHPVVAERDRLARDLEEERRKVTCQECGGNGLIHTQGPYHGSTSRCWKCNGQGRHLP
jgi:hypothetical protein